MYKQKGKILKQNFTLLFYYSVNKYISLTDMIKAKGGIFLYQTGYKIETLWNKYGSLFIALNVFILFGAFFVTLQNK